MRGLTTRRLHHAGVSFQVDFDLVDHRLVVRTNRGPAGLLRAPGRAVGGRFRPQLHQLLERLGVDVAIREDPYGCHDHPAPDDTTHAADDPEDVRRF